MLRIKYYSLEDSLINENIKIVNATDVHSNVLYLKDVISYAEYIGADVITIAGDLFDSVDNIYNGEIVDTLKSVKDIKIVISNGNHDLVKIKGKGLFAHLTYEPDYQYYNSLKESENIHVLLKSEDLFSFKSIDFTSLDPGQEWYDVQKEDSKVFKSILDEYLKELSDEKKFRVMLLHSCNGLIINNKLPEEIKNVNLILSGHNHGCLTPEFFQDISKNNRGLIGPYNRLFMKGSYGFWENGNTSVILSNGVTKMGESHGSKLITNIVNKLYKQDIEVIELKKGENHSLRLVKKIVQKH